MSKMVCSAEDKSTAYSNFLGNALPGHCASARPPSDDALSPGGAHHPGLAPAENNTGLMNCSNIKANACGGKGNYPYREELSPES